MDWNKQASSMEFEAEAQLVEQYEYLFTGRVDDICNLT